MKMNQRKNYQSIGDTTQPTRYEDLQHNKLDIQSIH